MRWNRSITAGSIACCWPCPSTLATRRSNISPTTACSSPFPRMIRAIPPASISPDMIDQGRLMLLEDGHCLRDHALAACSRSELRASAAMIGTSLHTLVQLVDNDLGVTMLPEMALKAGILNGTDVVARPVDSPTAKREIVLAWRRNSPREADFLLLAEELRAG